MQGTSARQKIECIQCEIAHAYPWRVDDGVSFHSINTVLTTSNVENPRCTSFWRRGHEAAKQRYLTSGRTAVSETRC